MANQGPRMAQSPFWLVQQTPDFLRELARRWGVTRIQALESRIGTNERIEMAESEEFRTYTQVYGEPMTVVRPRPSCKRHLVGWHNCPCDNCIGIRREVAICTRLALQDE